jgi:hypothetical protein
MSDQLSMFLNSLTDIGVANLGEAAEWMAGKSWQDSLDVARMIYPDNEERQDSFDIKDLQHELDTFRGSFGDDSVDLEQVVQSHW